MNFQTSFLICSIAFRQHRSMCVCATIWRLRDGILPTCCLQPQMSRKLQSLVTARTASSRSIKSSTIQIIAEPCHNTVIKGAVRRITPSVTVFNMCLTEASRNGDALQCEQWFRRTWAEKLLDPMQARRFSMHRHLQDGLEWIRARCD